MKRNRSLLIVTMISFAFALPAMAQAPGRMGGHGTRGGGQGEGQQALGSPQWLATYLDLNPDQITQWQAIRDDAQAQAATLHETRKANAVKLREELAKTSPDAETVGSYVIQNHALGTQIRAIHEAAQAKFADLLTADQKLKYEQWLEFRKSMPRRGPGGQGGAGGPGVGFGGGMGFGQGGGFGPGDGTCPCCED